MFEPLVLVVTVRLPVGAGRRAENDVAADPTAGAHTARDEPPLTEEWLPTLDRTKVWLAPESPLDRYALSRPRSCSLLRTARRCATPPSFPYTSLFRSCRSTCSHSRRRSRCSRPRQCSSRSCRW